MTLINEKGINIAVLGATGQVGMVMRRILDERNFPVRDLRFIASAHSEGKKIEWRGHKIEVEDVEKAVQAISTDEERLCHALCWFWNDNDITDDAMVVEKTLNYPIQLIEGSYQNIKITTPEDLEIAKLYLK